MSAARRLLNEQLEIDHVVRVGLGVQPTQSIHARAREIATADALDRSLPIEARRYRWEEDGRPTDWSRQVRAALELVDFGADPWDRMRLAAAILRGES